MVDFVSEVQVIRFINHHLNMAAQDRSFDPNQTKLNEIANGVENLLIQQLNAPLNKDKIRSNCEWLKNIPQVKKGSPSFTVIDCERNQEYENMNQTGR